MRSRKISTIFSYATGSECTLNNRTRRSVTPNFKLHTQEAYAITCLRELTIPIIGNSSCFSKSLCVALSQRRLFVCAIRHVTLSALTQIFLLAFPDCRSHLTPLNALESGDTNTGLHTHFLLHISS
jgi:hypothetical protein